MNRCRLALQYLFSFIAVQLGVNDRLTQFCDNCGRTRYVPFWLTNDVWISVAGNVNGHRHGAYCVLCFDMLARTKGIRLQWTATCEGEAMSERERKELVEFAKQWLRQPDHKVGFSQEHEYNCSAGVVDAHCELCLLEVMLPAFVIAWQARAEAAPPPVATGRFTSKFWDLDAVLSEIALKIHWDKIQSVKHGDRTEFLQEMRRLAGMLATNGEAAREKERP